MPRHGDNYWLERMAAVVTGTGTAVQKVQGVVADNGVAVGNPIRNGGVYNSATQTYAAGDIADVQMDVNGNTKVREQYAPAYEDNTNSKAVVEHRYTPSYVLTADTLVKTGAGLIHTATFSCNDAAPTAGSIIIFDNTAESGSQIFNHTFTTTPFAPFTVTFDMSVTTGIYVGFTTTNDVNVSLSFR